MDADRSLEVKYNLDESKLKTVYSNLVKTTNENQKLRAKYINDPRKFANSETELFAILDELQSVASQTELYHVLVEKKVYKLLTSLIEHDNLDICSKVLVVIQELISVDSEDSNESTEEFIESLHRDLLCEKLVANFERLNVNVKEEAEIINNSISIINYMIGPGCNGYEGHLFSSLYIDWAVAQLKSPKFNNFKLSMIDLLITIISDGENGDHFYKIKGIGALLHQIAYYRRVAPSTPSEKEYLHQVLHCLCYCLSCHDENVTPTKDEFFEEEGVELVELVLRERRDGIQKSAIKHYMLKAFNSCITPYGKVVTPCCERFIEILGLRVLFPIFLKPQIIIPKNMRKREAMKIRSEIQENTIQIIANLLKYCQKSGLLQRILIKFAEKKFEKFDHLIRLLNRYSEDYNRFTNEIEKKEKNNEKVDDILADKCDHTYLILMDLNYIFLLICYLSEQYETYDVNSGEKFSNRLEKLFSLETTLRENIVKYTREVVDKETSKDVSEDKNSLSFLLAHLEKVSSKNKE